MKVIVTRPSPDAEKFAAEVKRIGAEPVFSPVMVIRHRPLTLDLAGVGGLAFTSANGVRALSQLTPSRSLPVFAVGMATADAAAEAGFLNITTARGDVMSLSELITRAKLSGIVLHLAGSDRAGDLVAMLTERGVRARRLLIYDAEKYDRLSPEAAAALRASGEPAAVALFSPRSARLFLDQVAFDRLSGALERAAALCLSGEVAKAAASAAWAAILTARMPTSADMLDLVEARLRR